MTNNRNPNNLKRREVQQKSQDIDVVRATVMDTIPEIHSVRVNPRGDNAPFIAPVVTPIYGSQTLPDVGERVMVLFLTATSGIVLGSVYLIDGDDPPNIDIGSIRIGNDTGSHVTVRDNGAIKISTGSFQPIDIDHQSGSVRMSTDQVIPGDNTYTKVNFDTEQDDPEELFNPSTNQFIVRHEGQHRVESTVEIEAAGQNNRYTIAIFADGSPVKRKNKQSAVNEAMSINISTTRRFFDDTTLDIRMRDNSGSPKTINSDSVATEFSIERHGI